MRNISFIRIRLPLLITVITIFSVSACIAHHGQPLLTVIKKAAGETNELVMLLKGNERFAGCKSIHPDGNEKRRDSLINGQHPFAVILSCSDSRVPPEIVFDQGLGDLFVIRTAGNLVDSIELGSIEYAVEHLHVKLIVVLGHESCGAVTAYVQHASEHNHIQKLVEYMGAEKEMQEAVKMKGDTLDNCVRANIRHVVALLRESEPVLAEKYINKELDIKGARYDLKTGKVEIIE